MKSIREKILTTKITTGLCSQQKGAANVMAIEMEMETIRQYLYTHIDAHKNDVEHITVNFFFLVVPVYPSNSMNCSNKKKKKRN